METIPMEITGSWKLKAFTLENKGNQTSWGVDVHGLLIYTPTGQVSVAINKAIVNDPDQSDSENLFDSILFYAGTYQVEGNLIRHQVTNASNPARIGKELIRTASLAGDELTLVTPEESFRRATLIWQRL